MIDDVLGINVNVYDINVIRNYISMYDKNE